MSQSNKSTIERDLANKINREEILNKFVNVDKKICLTL